MGLHTLVLQPHTVVENDVRKHYLKLASCPGKDDVQSEQKKLWGGGSHTRFLAILFGASFSRSGRHSNCLGFW